MKKISLTQYANTIKIKSNKYDNRFYLENLITKIKDKGLNSPVVSFK